MLVLMAQQSKTRRVIGLIVAPLMILAGTAICYNWMANAYMPGGKLNWLGPIFIIAGGLWLASDWFDL